MKITNLALLSVLSLTLQSTSVFADSATAQPGDANEKTLVCVRENASMGDQNTYLKISTAADQERPVTSAIFFKYVDNSGALKPVKLEFLGHDPSLSISRFGNSSLVENVNVQVSLSGLELAAKVAVLKNGLIDWYDCSTSEKDEPVTTEKTCEKAILKMAKTNLEFKAKAYGQTFTGDLVDESLKLTGTTKSGSTYSVGGTIGKADYLLKLKVDSQCGLESVKIE